MARFQNTALSRWRPSHKMSVYYIIMITTGSHSETKLKPEDSNKSDSTSRRTFFSHTSCGSESDSDSDENRVLPDFMFHTLAPLATCPLLRLKTFENQQLEAWRQLLDNIKSDLQESKFSSCPPRRWVQVVMNVCYSPGFSTIAVPHSSWFTLTWVTVGPKPKYIPSLPTQDIYNPLQVRVTSQV